MNLIGCMVAHKTLGTGTVVAQDDRYISVEFAAKTSKFPYPDPNTFTKFLLAQDPTIQAALLQELADALAELQRQARAEEAARRAAEEAQSAAQA